MMQHIPIWGEIIPGNSPANKRSVMEVEPFKLPQMLQFGRMILAATAKDFAPGNKSRIDSYTWHVPIRNGWEKETFEDIPYIDAFPVRNARQAVLVIPGGAYAYKQSDVDGQGKQNEGDRVAKALNERSVSAFVLWYRSNPYCFPIPLLDVQRAVRFLRAHADEYGFDPEQIHIIGFSAGGYQSLGFANILRGHDAFPVDYTPDEIDLISDRIQSASAGYPLVSFRAMPNEVLAVMNGEDAGDKEIGHGDVPFGSVLRRHREDFYAKGLCVFFI